MRSSLCVHLPEYEGYPTMMRRGSAQRKTLVATYMYTTWTNQVPPLPPDVQVRDESFSIMSVLLFLLDPFRCGNSSVARHSLLTRPRGCGHSIAAPPRLHGVRAQSIQDRQSWNRGTTGVERRASWGPDTAREAGGHFGHGQVCLRPTPRMSWVGKVRHRALL